MILMQILELVNNIYELCVEDNDVFMHHDTFAPTDSFEGVVSGRALTQVSRQVRTEFLLVYKRTTEIHMPLENLAEYISTWLSGAMSGTIMIDTHRHNKERCDAGSLMGTGRTMNVDVMPLVQLRRDNDDFHFHINSKPKYDNDNEDEDEDDDGYDDDDEDEDEALVS